MMVASVERKGLVILKRSSETISKMASSPNTANLDSAEAPCLKNGGGVWSIDSSDMGSAQGGRPFTHW